MHLNLQKLSFKIDNEARRAVIYFNEAMDVASLTNPANYSITFDGKAIALPSNAVISVIENGKGVVIDLPVQINGRDVTSALWTAIRVQGVKDLEGNYLENFTTGDILVGDYNKLNASKTYGDGHTGALVSNKKVEVKVDQAVERFVGQTGDVKAYVGGTEISVANVTANNSNIITVELVNPIYTTTGLTVVFNEADFRTVAQSTIKLGQVGSPVTVGDSTYTLNDKVAPEVKLADGQTTFPVGTATGSTYEVNIDFTEALKANINEDLLAQDFVVTRLTGATANIPVKSDTANQKAFFEIVKVDADTLKVVITDTTVTDGAGLYTIGIREDAKYVQDVAGNTVKAFEAIRTAK